MSYVSSQPVVQPGIVRRSVDWLDERGPISWIVLMLGGFIFAGPLGLLVLGFILMTGRFRSRNCRSMGADHLRGRAGWERSWDQARSSMNMTRSSGNAAFDAYKADTIARLEREQTDFEAFLHRLREARDKAEFDQYMEDRARAAAEDASSEAGTDVTGTDATPNGTDRG